MNVKIAQMDALILETDIWYITNLAVVKKWKWSFVKGCECKSHVSIVQSFFFKSVPRWDRGISVLRGYIEQ